MRQTNHRRCKSSNDLSRNSDANHARPAVDAGRHLRPTQVQQPSSELQHAWDSPVWIFSSPSCGIMSRNSLRPSWLGGRVEREGPGTSATALPVPHGGPADHAWKNMRQSGGIGARAASPRRWRSHRPPPAEQASRRRGRQLRPASRTQPSRDRPLGSGAMSDGPRGSRTGQAHTGRAQQKGCRHNSSRPEGAVMARKSAEGSEGARACSKCWVALPVCRRLRQAGFQLAPSARQRVHGSIDDIG